MAESSPPATGKFSEVMAGLAVGERVTASSPFTFAPDKFKVKLVTRRENGVITAGVSFMEVELGQIIGKPGMTGYVFHTSPVSVTAETGFADNFKPLLLDTITAFRVSDLTGLRFRQNRGQDPVLSGEVRWSAPWGAPIKLMQGYVAKVDEKGHVHILMSCVGNLGIYIQCQSSADVVMVLDAAGADLVLPADLSSENIASRFRWSARQIFRRRDKAGAVWEKTG